MSKHSLIMLNSKSKDVKKAKSLLNRVLSLTPPLDEDDRFDERTRDAVMAFQRSERLDVDGIVGPASWARLLARAEGSAAPSEAKAGEGPSPIQRTARAGGLLLEAFRAGKTDEITWCDVAVGDLVVTVASDAMKAPLGDQAGIRLPVTYDETVAICRELDCVTPTKAIADAMYEAATACLQYVGLYQTAADGAKMPTLDFVLRFHDAVEAQIESLSPAAGGLSFGAWKLWIVHPRLAERGAVNYGFWDKQTRKPIQTVGGRHDAAHYDYSQLLQPVKRMARDARTGVEVDLLDHFETVEGVPRRFLDPYRRTAEEERPTAAQADRATPQPHEQAGTPAAEAPREPLENPTEALSR